MNNSPSISFAAIQDIRMSIKDNVSRRISNDVWNNLRVIGRDIEDTVDTQLWAFFHDHLKDWLE